MAEHVADSNPNGTGSNRTAMVSGRVGRPPPRLDGRDARPSMIILEIRFLLTLATNVRIMKGLTFVYRETRSRCN